jgi:phosphate transport system substrate-binding protein
VLTDQPGKAAWPITGVTYAIVHKQQLDAAKGKEVLSFFNYAFKNGAAAATELDYVPMPESVAKLIETAWKNNLKDGAGKAVW